MADAVKKHYELPRESWEQALQQLAGTLPMYAPVKRWNTLDYELLNPQNIPGIVYNTPKPVSPLKLFVVPVKENVVAEPEKPQPFVVMGAPSCDLWALDLLDLFFLNSEYVDSYYKARREQMILIGTDCHSANTHCHCTTYGINPFPEKNHDVLLSMLGNRVILEVNSAKGEAFIEKLRQVSAPEASANGLPEALTSLRSRLKDELEQLHKQLPNYQETNNIVRNAKDEIWQKYSATCVSCGACATSCPTCTCFLLIDRPGFEKVRQMDACQYPGFQKVAGGEDPHARLPIRFRNRYMCKYVFRPEKYDALACTGCGRCIEGCIGAINKNELFIELTQ